MYKFLFIIAALLVLSSSMEAQRCYCCGCRRYMDLSLANYDGYYYGYVDNINYPDQYGLPINYFFNYCPPCRCDAYNSTYFQNCVNHTIQKNGNSQNQQGY